MCPACCFGKGRGSTETPSKLFANHNTLGQLTNHNTFCFSESSPSSNPELIDSFVPGWGERYCNVNYVKNNAIFEPPSMRACSSSTPPKQNQDFVKEHNRTPLSSHSKPNMFCKFQKQRSSPLPSYKTLESRPGKFTHTHKTTLNRSICTNSGLHRWNCIGYIWLVLYEIIHPIKIWS